MSYKVYTDKQEIFECKIYLEGASLTTAKARLNLILIQKKVILMDIKKFLQNQKLW